MDLTGFLFGNVNEEGELEDESVLDKVAQLSGCLPVARLGPLPREFSLHSRGRGSSSRSIGQANSVFLEVVAVAQ